MSISSRQSELFAGEVWQVLYQAFTSINFNASDPATINQALQSYIQANYPENFNDWIVSSEFVAIIDLLSWLAGTLAYKTDLSVRENFIDTAEARTSILRLARFLSYNPSRNQCATGILKLVEVSTNDDVFDSFGNNLANITVNWNDPDNSNWLEQFTTVLNSAFVTTNPYGVPLNTGTVQGVNVQLYRVNGYYASTNFAFSSTVSGSSMNFEICNGTFTDGGVLYELTPNPNNAFQFYYLSDGNGNGSAQTGFFLLFKQGTTQSDTFVIPSPSENQVLTASGTNINNTDVWVQSVDDNGNVTNTWIQVPVMLDENITYNSLPINERNIFSVITLDNDGVSARFSDGLYGNAPSGNIKLTYRVSNGLAYSIQPQEINNVSIPVSYINRVGATKTLTLTFSLTQTVSNAVPTETIEQIRFRAPQVFQTQNRMVSGEDYNSFPLQTNLALKLKAVNRIYSGQSRYIDLNDPTGTYQDLSIFADDGILFKEEADTYVESPVSLNYTPNQFVGTYIQPALSTQDSINAIQNIFLVAIENGLIPVPTNMVWVQSNAGLYSSTGYFTVESGGTSLVQPGAMIQFSLNNELFWVGVDELNGQYTSRPALNTAGPVVLSEIVPSGAIVVAILPAFNSTITNAVATIQNSLSNRLSFSLIYDFSVPSNNWIVGAAMANLGPSQLIPNTTQVVMLTCNYISNLWQITTRGLRYVFESISTIEWFDSGLRAIDQQTGQASVDLVRVLPINENLNDYRGYALNKNYDFSIDGLWFYLNGYPEPRRTLVNFADENNDGFPDSPDSFLKIISPNPQQTYLFWSTNPPSGIPVTSNVYPNYNVIAFDTQTNMYNSAPNPELYSGTWDANANIPVLQSGTGNAPGTYLTVSNPGSTNLDGNFVWAVNDTVVFNGNRWVKAPPVNTEGFVVSGNGSTGIYNNSFWVYSGPLIVLEGVVIGGGWILDTTQTYAYEIGRGPNLAAQWNTVDGTTFPAGTEIFLQWKHYAPSTSRIDPSSQNINDMFVLTYAYDTAVRQWIANGADSTSIPQPPSELDLRIAFESMENYRMFSDALVWRPVSYKFLFGPSSDPSVQMNFKVVRIPNASVSNGLIQSNVINAINTYFDAAYWDFGETFYWSELCAYIHQQLAGQIASIVPVPVSADSYFGDGFEISSRPDQVFISTAQVANVIIIDSNTPANLRIS